MLASVTGLFRRPQKPPGAAEARRAERAPPTSSAVPAEAPARLDWPVERMTVADALWAPGFALPGGEAEILRLAAPLGLSAACSVLLLDCGAGGPARCLAERLETWVNGFEHDPALLAAATRRCAAAGLGRRVRIEAWEPAAPRFPARASHHALALEPLRHATAALVLPAVAAALRPGGNLVLVEAAADAGAPLTEWLRSERREPPPTEAAVTRALEGLGFDVRVVEDMTERHVQLTVRGWRALVEAMGEERPTPARAAPVVREAERWLRRARLMRTGHLRLMR
jgi:SAM-dependent methyltransferase